MTPRNKVAALVLGISLGYGIFIAYVVLTSDTKSKHPFPEWVPLAALGYMLGGILLASVLVPRILRNEPKPLPNPASTAILAYSKWKTIYLVLVWCAFFIYGAYETALGRVQWQRAVPAGAILLVFIAIFARSAYRMFNVEAPIAPYPPPELLQDSVPHISPDEPVSNHQRNLRILLIVAAAVLFLLRFL